MKTEQRTVTTIIAEEGKLLRRKSDGWIAGEQVTLGYNYYESGIGLSAPKLETPEDYEEIDQPEDYEQPPIIDQGRRIINMQKILHETQEEINTFDLSDDVSLQIKEMYPEWKEGISVKKKEKYRVGEDLWRVIKDHTTQANWKPGIETSSLWERVEEGHKGTVEDPIPYAPPMEIFEGNYYIQNKIKYKCIRDSGIPLSHDLSALVGTYVELV